MHPSIEDQITDYMAQGKPRSDAEEEAIQQMGDPVEKEPCTPHDSFSILPYFSIRSHSTVASSPESFLLECVSPAGMNEASPASNSLTTPLLSI